MSPTTPFPRCARRLQHFLSAPPPARRCGRNARPWIPRAWERLEPRVLLSAASFAAATTVGTGNYPTAVAVGDFNGDGQVDLAATNQRDGTVSILLGNGDGTFKTKLDGAVGWNPVAIVVGDFNGDGKLDVAVANAGSGYGSTTSGTVSIMLGNGDGTFHAATNYTVGNNPASLAVGDFNGDGKADLAVANYDSGTVSILLGNGDGTFPAKTDYPAGNTPNAIAVGDFNGDSKTDLAVTNFLDGTVSILLGNGNGTFQTRTTSAVGSYPESVTVADFNGDGKSDLAVANANDGTGTGAVNVLLGNGNGTFPTPTAYPITSAFSVQAGDFNGDGKIDLAVANAGQWDGVTNTYVVSPNVTILAGTGTGGFAAPSAYTVCAVGHVPLSVAAGDFNGDGKPDLAAANYGNNTLSILANTGTQTATATTTTVQPSPALISLGQSLTLTATVGATGAGTPAGWVTFFDGTTALETRPLTNGTASYTTTTLALGNHWITAQYAGDGSHARSTSAAALAGVGTAHQRYVELAYMQLLNRAADPSGLTYFTGLLDASQPWSTVPQALMPTAEYYGDVITNLYNTILHRAPDSASLATLVSQMQAGTTVETIQATLLGSSEYYTLVGGTNTAFINALYQAYLNRTPSSTEVASWLTVLADPTKTRQYVATTLTGTAEARGITITALYQTFLRRPATATEITNWQSQMATGTSQSAIIAALLTSTEYLTLNALS